MRAAPIRKIHTPWCNGNTAPFGGVIHGSNPCGVAHPVQAFFAITALRDLRQPLPDDIDRHIGQAVTGILKINDDIGSGTAE